MLKLEGVRCFKASSFADLYFHFDFGVFLGRCKDDMVRVENIHILIFEKHFRCNSTFSGMFKRKYQRIFGIQTDLAPLQIHDDIGSIFINPGDSREFMGHIFKTYSGYGRTFQRRQQHSAQRVANSGTETTFKRLGSDANAQPVFCRFHMIISGDSKLFFDHDCTLLQSEATLENPNEKDAERWGKRP